MTLCTKGSTAFSRRQKGWRTLSGLLACGLATGLAGCGGDGISGGISRSPGFLYTESNDPTGNRLLAFTRAADGSLAAPVSIDLKGTGFANPTEQPGPPDADQQVITNADHSLLFAVNSGSNTVAVLKVNTDGTATHVAGSPFASGGTNPFSLYLLGSRLYVANKNVGSSASAGAGTPNYTVFNVAADGTLSQITSATRTASAGASPSQILASPDGTTMFTSEFFAPIASPASGGLRSFHINADGSLTQVGTALQPTTPAPTGTSPSFVPFFSLYQGVQVHPTQRVLYACVPITGKIDVYNYDASGALTYNSSASLSGVVPCWIKINRSATRMYVVCTGDGSVSTMDITNPLAPVEMQHVPLLDPGPTFPLLPIIPNIVSSAAAEETLDPSETNLYVVSHHANPATSYTGGNTLHRLTINTDGTLTEQATSINLNLPNAAQPQGLVTF